MNRNFLLFGLITSILLPLIGFVNFAESAASLSYSLPVIEVAANALDQPIQDFEPLYFEWIFFAVSGLFTLLFLLGLFKVFQVLKTATKAKLNGKVIWQVALPNTNFTFLNKIILSKDTPEEALSYILKHEEVHQKHWHTVDLLVIEILKIFCWYNPFVLFYKTAMVENHEFIADKYAAKGNHKEYQGWLLNSAFVNLSPVLINQFLNQSLIKSRIKMLQNPIRKNQTIYPIFAMIALVATVLISCSNQENVNEQVMTSEGQEVLLQANEVDKMAEFPGGMESLIAFFQENLKYPETAKEDSVEGKVFISFIVQENGQLKDAEVVKSADERLDVAALEIVNAMPNWNPAEKDGKKVAMKMTLPVAFALN